jgi:hypothetical protein
MVRRASSGVCVHVAVARRWVVPGTPVRGVWAVLQGVPEDAGDRRTGRQPTLDLMHVILRERGDEVGLRVLDRAVTLLDHPLEKVELLPLQSRSNVASRRRASRGGHPGDGTVAWDHHPPGRDHPRCAHLVSTIRYVGAPTVTKRSRRAARRRSARDHAERSHDDRQATEASQEVGRGEQVGAREADEHRRHEQAEPQNQARHGAPVGRVAGHQDEEQHRRPEDLLRRTRTAQRPALAAAGTGAATARRLPPAGCAHLASAGGSPAGRRASRTAPSSIG